MAKHILIVGLLIVTALITTISAAKVAYAHELIAFNPSQKGIPANTLRLYLTFSKPMSRGQVREKIRLFKVGSGEEVHAFLNLAIELWNPEQTRLTLLFDPGRIKQGVGPNKEIGMPLEKGEQYRLIISENMKDSTGISLGKQQTITFSVIAPEFSSINVDSWLVNAPRADSREALIVLFDRQLDIAGVYRLIAIKDAMDALIQGQIESDGLSWRFVPEKAWPQGSHRLRISSELEDISGNTPLKPFDAPVGTIGTKKRIFERSFEIR